MSLVVDVPQSVEERLEAGATREGISTSEYASRLLTRSLMPSAIGPDVQKQLNAPSIVLLQSWLAAAEAPRTPDEVAESEDDLEQLMRNLNTTRREAGERLLFPDADVQHP
jgi:hypothetical protein